MKFNPKKYILISLKYFILFFSLIFTKTALLNAEDSYLNEIEIDNTTKFDTSSSDLPTNPFEMMNMIRRANSMNEETKPSVSIDDALKLFSDIKEKENL